MKSTRVALLSTIISKFFLSFFFLFRSQNTNGQTGRCTAVYEKQNPASRGQG